MRNEGLSKDEQELLDAIIELLVNTEPETPADLDDELREMGYDPDAMTAKIEAVVQDAWAKSPYNWRVRERKKIEKERKRYRRSKTRPASSLNEARRRLQQFIERHGPQLATAHRNLDEISDEDVASLLQQYEFLTHDKSEEE